jgi:hypothetical protein
MLKKCTPLLLLPLCLAGCTTVFTNLTPLQQTRDSQNLYKVEVAIASRQQTLRWQSIKPQIIVGTESYPMRPTPLMTNRFEGLIPVPSSVNTVQYHYKFDFEYNAFGPPRPDSAISPAYTLRIKEAPPGQ